MQALMLAAGMGNRLGKYTQGNTKCMMEVAGKTLIQRAVEALKIAGILRFIIVTGYKGNSLKSYLAENITDMELIYVHNEKFDSTNNIYSLYLAREFLLQDDTILLESDLIFYEGMISDIVNNGYPDVAAVVKFEAWMDGTVTRLDAEDNIIEFIEKKDISFSNTCNYYKTANIYKFSKEFSNDHYVPSLEAYIKAYGKNEYYEMVLKAIDPLSHSSLKGLKISGKKWYEIDDRQDFDIAKTLFAADADQLRLYQERHGGYWRFSDFIDFCYPTNPHFPPRSMLNKIKYSFNELVTQYPSTLFVQNINAAQMFDVDEDEIMVANGAAELINSLLNVVAGKIAITVPTFNEYLSRFEHCDMIKITTDKNDYQLNKTDFLEVIDSVGTVVIINPDNPSGSFLKYQDIIEIIEKCSKLDKRIIIDESFIDFADEKLRYTLINSHLMKKYPQLIVIKSISKSYGIPGLRLGVLACGDKEVLAEIKKSMPIWNINSLAEYFLQIVTLYKKEYIDSLDKIAYQRSVLAQKLSRFDFLKVYDSQANFLLCEVRAPFTAVQITTDLLRNYRILIKDLSGKDGFADNEYVRIAVKDEKENDALIAALGELLKLHRSSIVQP